MDIGRSQTGNQEISALQALYVVALVFQGAAASIPTEMMKLAAIAGDVGPADHPPVAIRGRIHIDDGHRVVLLRGAVKGHHIRELLAGGGRRVRSGPVERRIDRRMSHATTFPKSCGTLHARE